MSTVKKVIEDLVKTLKDVRIFVLTVLLASISLLSIILWFTGNSKYRYVLNFEHMNKPGLYVESRFLPKADAETSLRMFIDDMILGPVGDRYRLLFPRGTKVVSCFVNDGILYVSLSEEAFYIDGNGSSENKEGAEIFRKNVFRNFRNIDIINLYIGSRKIYED